MRQFDRQVVLQVGPPGSTGREWRELRVQFEVEHTRGRSPNSATIQVYNLTDDSIASFRRDDAVVRLLAGYDQPRLIFQGTPTDNGLSEKKKSVDRILEVEAQDGGRAIKRTRLNFSAATASGYRQVLQRIASKLDGVALGRVEIPDNVSLPQGTHLTGPARDILDRVAEGAGADWSIQDGKLRLLAAGEDTGTQGAIFSSARGNLVGAPEKTDKGIEAKALLTPSIRPGDRFRLETPSREGIYRARGVTFQGDTWGQDYYVTVNGVPV